MLLIIQSHVYLPIIFSNAAFSRSFLACTNVSDQQHIMFQKLNINKYK